MFLAVDLVNDSLIFPSLVVDMNRFAA